MKKNVLLVEDDPALRMVMREVLKDEFEIDEADNGQEGIDKGLKAQADIVILDYHLPKKNGLEVIAELKKKFPDTPVIVVTGYLNPDSEEKFNRLGANRIFPKPFNYKSLLETIKLLTAQKKPSAPQTAPLSSNIVAFDQNVSETSALQHSLATMASLAEKVEFLETVTEKYWIEPKDIATIRETARCMNVELRKFYGKMNASLRDAGVFSSPLLNNTNKPMVSGKN